MKMSKPVAASKLPARVRKRVNKYDALIAQLRALKPGQAIELENDRKRKPKKGDEEAEQRAFRNRVKAAVDRETSKDLNIYTAYLLEDVRKIGIRCSRRPTKKRPTRKRKAASKKKK